MASNLGQRFIDWALRDPAVEVLVQIGSQVRQAGAPGAADGFSDWDFQVISASPAQLADRGWAERAGVGVPLAHIARGGRLGSALKITTLFADGEIDLVVIPAEQLRMVRAQVEAKRHVENPAIMRALADLSLVLAGGYRILKGEHEAGSIYRFVAESFPLPRLDNAAVRELAEGFVCDYVSTRRKIERGELIAAQRWLHHQLAETNFRLLHELQQREGRPSFPDARRVETTSSAVRREQVAVEARLETGALKAAAEKSAATLRSLMAALLGPGAWQWPDGLF